MSDSRTFTRLLPALLLLALPHLTLAESVFSSCSFTFAIPGSIAYDGTEVVVPIGAQLKCTLTSVSTTRVQGADVLVSATIGTGRSQIWNLPLSGGNNRHRYMLREGGRTGTLLYNIYNELPLVDAHIVTDGSNTGVHLHIGNSIFGDDSMRVNVFPNREEGTVNFPSGGNFVRLRILPGQESRAGTYTDTVVVTIMDRESGQVFGTTANTFTATIEESCSLSFFSPGGGESFVFRDYDPAEADSNRHFDNTIDVMCSPGAAYRIMADNGQHSDGTGNRMKLEGGDSYLRYGLYRDIGHTVPWGEVQNMPSELRPGSRLGFHFIYAEIPAGQRVPAGDYRDRVVFTVTVD